MAIHIKLKHLALGIRQNSLQSGNAASDPDASYPVPEAASLPK